MNQQMHNYFTNYHMFRHYCVILREFVVSSSLSSTSTSNVVVGNHHHHHHDVHEGLGVFPVPWSSRCSWSLRSW